MIIPDYKVMDSLSKEYSIIPMSKEIDGDMITPIMLLHKLARISKQYYLLESIEDGKSWGRYSFLGFSPKLRIRCKNHQVTIEDGDVKTFYSENPYHVVRELLSQYKSPIIEGLPSFTGGLVGYFSYDMIKYYEPTLKLAENPYSDMNLMLYDKVIAYDHFKQKIHLIVSIKTDHLEENYENGLKNIQVMEELITSLFSLPAPKKKQEPQFLTNVSKEEFISMVQQGKEYIKHHEITQVVLSRRFESIYTDSLLDSYRMLRATNPSPYMVYMQDEDTEIICTSPETLVRLHGGKLITFPIAGSKPRGRNLEEDLSIEEELLKDKKELSEHDMLVELAKDDLSKVCEVSSIEVTNYKDIRRYSKIMHITSQVEGHIDPRYDALDAIEALLPAGTLSGFPKTRACEIINELENVPRGIYGGALGYIDFNGNMDTCIAIRMGVKHQGKVYVQAGCGIVADSIPESEYYETEHKAKAILEAIIGVNKEEGL